jgi:hypothetical protein
VVEGIMGHNADTEAHPDIRLDIENRMTDMQKRINQVTEVIQPMEVLVPGININDGVYEAGYLKSDGTNEDLYLNMSFRSKNYIPVEGGKTITLYYDAAEWNGNNYGKAFEIAEYDSNKQNIVQLGYFRPYVNNQNSYTLNANTKYIRITFNNWSAFTTPVTDIKAAIYYIEDVRLEFVEYGFGSEMVYGVPGETVFFTQTDGTSKALSDYIKEYIDTELLGGEW